MSLLEVDPADRQEDHNCRFANYLAYFCSNYLAHFLRVNKLSAIPQASPEIAVQRLDWCAAYDSNERLLAISGLEIFSLDVVGVVSEFGR
jgi:hypothetical protein